MSFELVDSKSQPQSSNSLERFFESVRTCNPFLVNRVVRPFSEEWTDVFGIHEIEFRRVLNLVRQAQSHQAAIGISLWGEVGVGKSHLLARLGRWAKERQLAQYVFLRNVQVDPSKAARDLLRYLLKALTLDRRPPHHQSQLFALINGAVRHAMGLSGMQRGNWTQISSAFQTLANEHMAADPSLGQLFNRTIYQVLFRYYQAAHPGQHGKGHAVAELALNWLAGETLTADQSAKLGIDSDRQTTDSHVSFANQHVKQVVAALTQMASDAGQVFLLCLDQMDNLEKEQVAALARYLHDLLDSAGNLVMITAGVKQTMQRFLQEGVISETNWDRIGQFPITLGRISKSRGREMLWARLQKFLERARGIEEIEALICKDRMFPLDSDWLEDRLENTPDIRARELLAMAAERWQSHQEILTTTPGIIWLERWRGKLDEIAPMRHVQKNTTIDSSDTKVSRNKPRSEKRISPPPDREQLQRTIGLLLDNCLTCGECSTLKSVETCVSEADSAEFSCDCIVGHRRSRGDFFRIGICSLVTDNMEKTAATLGNLLKNIGAVDKTVLITDSRRTIPLDTEGRRSLNELTALGSAKFEHISLTAEEYTELEQFLEIQEQGKKRALDAGRHIPVNDNTPPPLPRLTYYHYQSHRLLRRLLCPADEPSDDTVTL